MFPVPTPGIITLPVFNQTLGRTQELGHATAGQAKLSTFDPSMHGRVSYITIDTNATEFIQRAQRYTILKFIILVSAYCQSRPSVTVPEYIAEEDYEEEPDSPALVSATASNIPVSHIYTKPHQFEVLPGKAIRLPCNVSYPGESRSSSTAFSIKTNFPSLSIITLYFAENVVVLWMRNGTYMLYSDTLPYVNEDEKKRIIRENDGSLVIYGFSEDDEATYTCSISDTSESVVHTVRLKRPPTTTMSTIITTLRPSNPPQPHIKKLEVRPGKSFVVDTPNIDLTLSCLANWTPSPKITWSFMVRSFLTFLLFIAVIVFMEKKSIFLRRERDWRATIIRRTVVTSRYAMLPVKKPGHMSVWLTKLRPKRRWAT